jgi:hypothetical protein
MASEIATAETAIPKSGRHRRVHHSGRSRGVAAGRGRILSAEKVAVAELSRDAAAIGRHCMLGNVLGLHCLAGNYRLLEPPPNKGFSDRPGRAHRLRGRKC